MTSAKTNKLNNIVKLGAIAVGVAGLIIIAKQLGIIETINNTLSSSLQWIDKLGTGGYIIFIFIYILASVLIIPGSLLTLGAGAIFGVIKGSILVSVGSTLAATTAFLIGRYLTRGWVAGQIEKYPKFKAIDEAVAKEGWKIIGLTRLSPIFPFVFLNYAFGITKVSVRDYILASWIGMMPGTLMYVYIGSLIGDIAKLGAGGREKTPLEWGLYGVGLIATVAVTVYVTKIAKQALNSQIDE